MNNLINCIIITKRIIISDIITLNRLDGDRRQRGVCAHSRSGRVVMRVSETHGEAQVRAQETEDPHVAA